MLPSTLAHSLLPMPADTPHETVETHIEQHMTALQVQQAELPPRAPPTRKLTREVSSAISESAAKRAEALAAMEAQVAEMKLSLEVSDIMLATAAAQQGKQSCLQTALLHELWSILQVLGSALICGMCGMQHKMCQPIQTLLSVRCATCQATAGAGRPRMHCAAQAAPQSIVTLCCPAGGEGGPPGGRLACERA